MKSDLNNPSPPKALYHYTDYHGAVGILNSRSLWLTKLQYLNDSAELKHATEVAEWCFVKLAEPDDATRREACDLLSESLKRIQDVHVLVFSMTEEPDLLSQWRAYAGNGGVALGFNVSELARVGAKQGFRLVPCCYDSQEQRLLMQPVASGALQRFMESLKKDSASLEDVLERVLPHLVRDFLSVAPRIKNVAFAEEREWRLISTARPDDDESIKVRANDRIVIPYWDFNLMLSAEAMVKLDDIVIGPATNQYLAMDAISLVLARSYVRWHGYRPSHIPLRSL